MHKIRILEFLNKRGESELKMISKNLHVPESIVKAEIERLNKDGLVVVNDDRVKISEKGIKELQDVKGI